MIPTTDSISELAHIASSMLEFVAIFVIISALILASVRAGKGVFQREYIEGYTAFKGSFGRGLLLGLEILVAADLLWTVAVEPTWDNLAALGLLVLIRTFLSWSIEVELEGRWQWQRNKIDAKQQECPESE